jgi:hypothetical protein
MLSEHLFDILTLYFSVISMSILTLPMALSLHAICFVIVYHLVIYYIKHFVHL